MNRPNVLIIADKEDVKHLDINKQSTHWNLFWKIIDYNRLHKSVDKIQSQIKKQDIDFILYSRNDQVTNRVSLVNRRLRTGYSSFSGIDEKYRIEEMKNCFEDFIRCDNQLDFDIPPPKKRGFGTSNNNGTFSIVFDTEQMGGVRYGIPRILKLLNKYDVKATFFVTNLMKKVYPNIVEKIQVQGHEIGLHGRWHEYLSDISREVQKNLIGEMVKDFGTEIQGVNFIARMDENSVSAFVNNKMHYLVYANINYYRFFGYSKRSTTPSLISLPDGNIWALPISVETYNAPWFSIKNKIDSTLTQSMKCEFQHITILCHPFRDGNLQHMKTTEKLLQHLTKKGLDPITLENLLDKLSYERKDFSQSDEIKKLFEQRKRKVILPCTKQDCVEIIPQNLILIYTMLKRGHAMF